MKTSTDRILTTHVGSLPRPADLLEFLKAKETGASVSTRRRSRRGSPQAVRDIVAQQVAAGIDSVSDGEQSKISYTFYVRHRLSGIGAAGAVDIDSAAADRGASRHPRPSRFHGAAARGARRHVVVRQRGGAVLHRPGPLQNRGPLETDVKNLAAAVAAATAGRGVYECRVARRADQVRARPLLQERRRLCRSARRCAEGGIRGDPQGRLHPADRRARSRLGPAQPVPAPVATTSSCASPTATSPRSTTRPRNIPPDPMRIHICWGNYEGPHTHDIPLAKMIDACMRARPPALLVRGGQSAPCP